jgi:hypothetical protein
MLTPKENYLRTLRHEKNEYVPLGMGDGAMFGFSCDVEKGPPGGGLDGFGVRWVTPTSGGGAAIPAPNEFVLDDITKWREKVKIPDVDAINWEADLARDMQFLMFPLNRETMSVGYSCGNGIFERLAALMGFENTLLAMAEEPEAVNELFTALTDYKIKFLEKVAQYYKPDTFTNFDDIATERGLFMSPAMYRELIKPHHKRLYKRCRELGILPLQHTCGKAEILVEDMIEIGVASWSSVQPTNDIVGLLKKYGDKIAFEGGYNTNGPPARPDASPEEIEAEVNRCYDEYGKYPGFCFGGFILVDSADPNAMMERMMPLNNAVMKLRAAGR